MRAAILAATALVCAAGAARADTYTGLVGNFLRLSDHEYRYTHENFDSTRGTLNSVVLSLAGLYTISITNQGAYSYDPVQFGPSTIYISGLFGDFGSHTVPYLGNTATTSFTFQASRALPNGFATGFGPATADYLIYGQGIRNIQGGYITESSSLSFTSASVLFDYTPFAVPEPATLGLLALGIAGAAAIRRRYVTTT